MHRYKFFDEKFKKPTSTYTLIILQYYDSD